MRGEADVKTGVVEPAKEPAAHRGQDQFHARDGPQFLFHSQGDFIHRAQAGAFRAGHVDVELAFVHVGGEIFLPDQTVERRRGDHDEEGEACHPPAIPEGPAQNSGVKQVDRAIEAGPRGRFVPSLFRAAALRPQEPGAHHGSEREGNQEADEHRHGGGEAELVKEPARDARHERDGHKDDHQAERGGHHRQPDVLGRGPRGGERPHLLFLDESKYILKHDDGVVDHDADHENEGEHGHAIERESEGFHHAEGGDDRGGNGHRRDEGRAPIAHEQEHDETGEDAAQDEVNLDLVQRLVDIARLVADHFDPHIRRKLGRQLAQFLLHALDHSHRVRARLPDDIERHSGRAVQPGDGALLFRPIFG